jgi:hypothetical protein
VGLLATALLLLLLLLAMAQHPGRRIAVGGLAPRNNHRWRMC